MATASQWRLEIRISPILRILGTIFSALRSTRAIIAFAEILPFPVFFKGRQPMPTLARMKEVKMEALVLKGSLSCTAETKDEINVRGRQSAAFRKWHGEKMISGFCERASSSSQYRSHRFLNARGDNIFSHVWTPPADRKMRAAIVLLHGLNEHSGRYESFAKELNQSCFGVFCMDWIGHGCSDGLHGYVDRLDHVVADAKLYLKMVMADHPDVPCFMFGHSTGGNIALRVSLLPGVSSSLAGVMTTSPAIHLEGHNKYLAALAPIASVLLPRLQVSPGGSAVTAKVSRDPQVLEAKYSDPLVYTGGLMARTGWEILNGTAALQRRLREITVPFLVMHGTSDRVTAPTGSQALYAQAPSPHKKIHLYQDLLHDLLFEPERAQITADILNWLEGRLSQLQCPADIC